MAEAVSGKKYDRGILICGTGLGMSLAANKVKGAYAALLSDSYLAERARKSNDANIACFGAFTVGIKCIEIMAEIFLESEFEYGCPSQAKVDRIRELDMSFLTKCNRLRLNNIFIAVFDARNTGLKYAFGFNLKECQNNPVVEPIFGYFNKKYIR